MKKIISLVLLSIFFLNSSYAEKYWSNKKDGPTSFEEAKEYLKSDNLDWIEGIWYDEGDPYLSLIYKTNENEFYMYIISFPERWNGSHDKYLGTKEGVIYKKKDNIYEWHGRQWHYKDLEFTETSFKAIIKKNVLVEEKANINFPSGQKSNLKKIWPRENNFNINFYNLNQNISMQDDKSKMEYISRNDYYDTLIYYYQNGNRSIGYISRDVNYYTSQLIWCGYRDFRGVNDFHKSYIEINKDGSWKTEIYLGKCDPEKISHNTLIIYKNKKYINLGIILILFISIFFYIIIRRKKNKNELSIWNKENKIKFKNHTLLKQHKSNLLDIEHEKDQRIMEKERKTEARKRIAEEKKLIAKAKAEEKKLIAKAKAEEKKLIDNDEDDNINNISLIGKIKRLKSLYEKGTLSKEEFERAKNKVLK